MTTRNMAEIRAMWIEQGRAEERNHILTGVGLEADIAELLAEHRIPPSTVYMDGSERPTIAERLKAEQFVSDLRRRIEGGSGD